MAMAADSSTSNHSPRSPVTPSAAADGGGGTNSPQSRRRGLPSPWAQVVRGGEPESSSATAVSAPRSPSSSPPIATATAPEQTPFSECSGQKGPPEYSTPETQTERSDDSNGNAGRPKKPAWNKPLNGVVEASSVMGGSVSWPALSESTRPTPKTSAESSKPSSDGSTSSSQGPIISQTPPKLVNTNANSNSIGNHGMNRQRLMKHRGGGPVGGSSHGGYNRPPPTPPPLPPAFPTIEMPPYGNYGNFVPPVPDSPARGARPMGGSGSQSGNDHSSHSQRNSSRRNNFGGRPRGDGQYHNNHGGRRDNDRRDVHLPHQFIPPPGSYIPPPPPGTAPFIASPHARPPFVGPVSFDMTSPFMFVQTLPPEPFRGGMPHIAQPPAAPMYFSVMEPPLQALIIKQIDYYFSDANLVKDDYLRSNMDDEGWVPVNLIASFPRVQQLTVDVQLILDSLRASLLVEVKEQGDKIRRRNDWKKWIPIHTSTRFSPDSGPQTPGTSSDDILTTSIDKSVEKMSLNEETSNKRGSMEPVYSQIKIAPERCLPEESTNLSNVANGELTSEEAHPSQT